MTKSSNRSNSKANSKSTTKTTSKTKSCFYFSNFQAPFYRLQTLLIGFCYGNGF